MCKQRVFPKFSEFHHFVALSAWMSHLFSLLSIEVSGLAPDTVLPGTESKSQIGYKSDCGSNAPRTPSAPDVANLKVFWLFLFSQVNKHWKQGGAKIYAQQRALQACDEFLEIGPPMFLDRNSQFPLSPDIPSKEATEKRPLQLWTLVRPDVF